jgi:hypothetical protein
MRQPFACTALAALLPIELQIRFKLRAELATLFICLRAE